MADTKQPTRMGGVGRGVFLCLFGSLLSMAGDGFCSYRMVSDRTPLTSRSVWWFPLHSGPSLHLARFPFFGSVLVHNIRYAIKYADGETVLIIPILIEVSGKSHYATDTIQTGPFALDNQIFLRITVTNPDDNFSHRFTQNFDLGTAATTASGVLIVGLVTWICTSAIKRTRKTKRIPNKNKRRKGQRN